MWLPLKNWIKQNWKSIFGFCTAILLWILVEKNTLLSPAWGYLLVGGIDFAIDDFVGFGNKLSFDKADPFSVSFWIQTTQANQGACIGNLDTGTNFQGWEITMNNGKISSFFLLNSSPTNQLAANSNTAFNDGNLHHILCTYDGSEDVGGMTIYLDGVDDTGAPSANSLTLTTISAADLLMGIRENNTTPIDAVIDDMAIWDVEITDINEIKNLANPRLKGMPLQIQVSNPKMYLPMNDGPIGTSADGVTIKDYSLDPVTKQYNGNDGVGNDGANNIGLIFEAVALSYPSGPIYISSSVVVAAGLPIPIAIHHLRNIGALH